MGEEKYLKIVEKEYVLQEWESNLSSPKEIFEAFENKFKTICKTYNYSPIFKFCMQEGFDVMKANNYTAFEIRIAMGSKKILKANFEPMNYDEQIEFMHDLTVEWCNKNPGYRMILFFNFSSH